MPEICQTHHYCGGFSYAQDNRKAGHRVDIITMSVTISAGEMSVTGSVSATQWDGDTYTEMASRTAASLVDAIEVLVPAMQRITPD